MKETEEVEDFINLGVVVNDKKEVLMIRRAEKETGRDKSVLEWAFPGGRQRLNETREECVKRKILSRTGYDINPIKQISLRMHPQFFVMVVYHLCRLVPEKPVIKPKEGHKVTEIKWVKPEEIKNLITTVLDPNVAKELGLS